MSCWAGEEWNSGIHSKSGLMWAASGEAPLGAAQCLGPGESICFCPCFSLLSQTLIAGLGNLPLVNSLNH